MTKPRVNRKLFRMFSFKKVDEDILDYYLEIQSNIEEIDEDFRKIYQYHAKKYLNLKGYSKEHYKIKQIYMFFAKIKSQYGNSFDVASEYNYDFSKSEKTSEKIEIETVLRGINNILKSIKKEIRTLLKNLEDRKVFVKNAELANLLDKLNYDMKDFSNRSQIFRDLEDQEKRKLELLLDRIYKRSAKERYIIKDKKSRKPIIYYCEKRIHDLRILELLPLIEHKDLEKRSQLANELHKDATLPIFHYNIIYKGRNIHVIPFNKQNVDWLKRNAS